MHYYFLQQNHRTECPRPVESRQMRRLLLRREHRNTKVQMAHSNAGHFLSVCACAPGYLEEEAVHTYTEMLKDIDSGAIENVAAPKIAIDHWGLPSDATLRDVVLVVRADEADHRLLNHHLSNRFDETKAARAADSSVTPYDQLGDVGLESIVGPTVMMTEKRKAAAQPK